MKRFIQGILVGIALTLAFLFMGPELLELAGVDPESVSESVEEIEKKFDRFSKEKEDASEQMDKSLKKAEDQVKDIMK